MLHHFSNGRQTTNQVYDDLVSKDVNITLYTSIFIYIITLITLDSMIYIYIYIISMTCIIMGPQHNVLHAARTLKA